MILTDREIQVAIENKQIVIDPPPAPTAYSSTSVDLSLSKQIRIWKKEDNGAVEAPVFCPAKKEFKFLEVLRKYSDRQEMDEKNGYIVEPGAFVLGWTAETISLPLHSRIAARVEGKSSLARLGIGIHITAPTIHAGFPGQIQLEICNHGPIRVRIIPGMAVCQLIFEQTFGTPEKGYTGQFFKQTQQ